MTSSPSSASSSNYNTVSVWDPTVLTLCFSMFSHTYLLMSIFPYAGYMVVHLDPTLDSDTAGYYAGFIGSSFMLGRFLTTLFWGWGADRIGRVRVLQISLIMSAIFSFWFGCSSSLIEAFTVRFLMGVFNAITASVRTLASEYHPPTPLNSGSDSDEDISEESSPNSPSNNGNGHKKQEEKVSAKIMSLIMGMWSLGFLLSPAIAGTLSDPVDQYPGLVGHLEASDNSFTSFVLDVLHTYPFFLPNFLGAVICLIAFLLVGLFVHETLPQPTDSSDEGESTDCCGIKKDYQALPESQDALKKKGKQEGKNLDFYSSLCAVWSRPLTRRCLFLSWGNSFSGLVMDEGFPLFCMSVTGGLGVKEAAIGKVLSICGLVFVLVQYKGYQALYQAHGLYGSIRSSSAFVPLAAIFMPWSTILHRHFQNDGSVSLEWSTTLYLAFWMAAYRVSGFFMSTSVVVALNQSVDPKLRGTMNGLSILGGSFSRGIGPIFAGYLVTYSVKWLGGAASWLVFGVIALLAIAVALSASISLSDQQVERAKRHVQEMEDQSTFSESNLRLTDGKEDETNENGVSESTSLLRKN